MELKETLKMPSTKFEMRGNLGIKEPKLVEKWDKISLYNVMNNNRKQAKEFILHDGPPYANGNIHCGHMMNRILKDFIIRYKNMSGFYTPFVLGWDTHGLPIENMVTKSGVNRKTTPIIEFRNKCREYALKQVENQKKQMLRLGVLASDVPYMTLLNEYEARQITLFSQMALKGLIYKGLKPVYWSPSSESALAEAEIEYHDVESYSIYVTFDVKDGKGVIDEDAKVVIWTTTPWTLPANLAVSANPNFEYGEYKTNKGKLVFLNSFKDKLCDEFDLKECKLIKTFKGSQLEYVVLKHPFYDRDSLMLVGEHVTDDAGTGFVHTAPGHGVEDYQVCLKYDIKPYCPVDSKGFMMDSCGPRLKGLFYEDANEVVLEILKENNCLLKVSKFTHSYPHDWRTNKPLIFRATDQWFCSIEPIRDQLLKEIDKVSWHPKWGQQRMHNMIKDRNDWCISRQRAWGVPIPIIYNEDKTPIIEKNVFDHISNLFKEHGSNIWYELEPIDLLPKGYKNSHSPNGKFTKETDIMDVWFDSGSSWAYNLVDKNLKYPCDLYLEGSDQYRGWFNSSLIISVACNGVSPYLNVASHGFVMDEHWEKMSKSKGNGIDPSKIANTYGADILRLWAATIDYHQDVRISESIIKQISEIYRKIRNTFKFMLGNIYDYNIDNPRYEYSLVDKFILNRLNKVINITIASFDEYNFSDAISAIVTYLSTDLSGFYLDINKDVLYCDGDSIKRQTVMHVIYQILDNLMRLLTPILPFTMEEVNDNLLGERKISAQLYDFPKQQNFDDALDKEFEKFLTIRSDVLKALEIARSNQIIGSSQEASVEIKILDNGYQNIFDNIKLDGDKLFVVSSFNENNNLVDGENYQVSRILVSHHKGEKCQRCWNYSFDTIKLEDGTVVCKRCGKVLGK